MNRCFYHKAETVIFFFNSYLFCLCFISDFYRFLILYQFLEFFKTIFVLMWSWFIVCWLPSKRFILMTCFISYVNVLYGLMKVKSHTYVCTYYWPLPQRTLLATEMQWPNVNTMHNEHIPLRWGAPCATKVPVTLHFNHSFSPFK
jgi:hypothetical protein